MGVLIEGVGGLAAGPSAANELRMPNPAGGQGGDSFALTDVAERALAEVGRLQARFDTSVAPATQPGPGVDAMRGAGQGEGVDPNYAMDQARMLAEQIEQTTRVQAQLVQFVMASSVSSSLGQNLNMFLRGQ